MRVVEIGEKVMVLVKDNFVTSGVMLPRHFQLGMKRGTFLAEQE